MELLHVVGYSEWRNAMRRRLLRVVGRSGVSDAIFWNRLPHFIGNQPHFRVVGGTGLRLVKRGLGRSKHSGYVVYEQLETQLCEMRNRAKCVFQSKLIPRSFLEHIQGGAA